MRSKVNELGLDHNMSHNQTTVTTKKHEDPIFSLALEVLRNVHPYIKFNTFDVVRHKKPTDDKLEEYDFTLRLRSRQNNIPYELDLLNGELETRKHEQKMNQSGCIMQRFDERTM